LRAHRSATIHPFLSTMSRYVTNNPSASHPLPLAEHCLQQYSQSGFHQCPVCKKSIGRWYTNYLERHIDGTEQRCAELDFPPTVRSVPFRSRAPLAPN
jgi:hypothetical protein